MPIYEYECSNCHHGFEMIQKVNDEPVTICPQCYKDTAVRLVSSAGFRLKGTGWYETDYKKSPKKTDNSSTTEKSAKE